MSLLLGDLHDALLNPGNPELARKAAEEVAGYDNAISELRSDVKVLKWMMGALLVLTLGILWQGFAIMGRLPN